MEPTKDPTVDPTTDPTTVPTDDPTVEPTIDPTIDPTLDPTDDPTVDPTIDPTVDPTTDPTTVPTDIPTTSPSAAPSNAPTTPPSNAPSRSPSLQPTTPPTLAPSSSPSSAPTRIPTLNVDDRKHGYDSHLDITYSIANLKSSDKQFVVSNTRRVVSDLEEILERNYFDPVVLQYKDFWVNIERIDGVDVEDDDSALSEYDLDIMNLQNRGNLVDARIETMEINTDFIIRTSDTSTFRESTETELRAYFNQSEVLRFEVVTDIDSLEAQSKYESDEPEDNTALILAILVVSIGFIGSIMAFIFNKLPTTKIDNAVFPMPLLICLNLYDFLSDINLSVTIMASASADINEVQFWLGLASILFIVIPFASNLFYAMRIQNEMTIKLNPSARSYFSQHLPPFIILCVFCAGTYPVLGLTSSRIFGLDFFNAGLLSSELHELSKIKIRSTIYLENGPQLIIQIVYSIITKEFATATILAFVASSLSVIASIIIYQAQKAVSDDYIITKYFIRLFTPNRINADQTQQIKDRKGLKAKLGEMLCQIYGISHQSVEVGFVTVNDNGCLLHIQQAIFKADLETLKKKLMRNMNPSTGYLIQITGDLYLNNLFELNKEKILNALVSHFGFEKKHVQKEFSVAYFEQFEEAMDDNEDQLGNATTSLVANNAGAPNLLTMMTKQMTYSGGVRAVEDVEAKQDVEMEPLLTGDVNAQDLVKQFRELEKMQSENRERMQSEHQERIQQLERMQSEHRERMLQSIQMFISKQDTPNATSETI
eukprot:793368_1